MKLKIEFDCDNAAFEGNDMSREIARILRDLANDAERCCPTDFQPDSVFTFVHDTNGNRVGAVEFISANK